MHTLSVLHQLARMNLLRALHYRADFLAAALGYLLSLAALAFMMGLLLTTFRQVAGWGLYEYLFLFGFTASARALWDTFFGGVLRLFEEVRSGRFDRYLIRPSSPLFLLLAEGLGTDTLLELALGLSLVYLALGGLGAEPSWALFLALLASGTLVLAALHLFVNALAFWAVDPNPLSFVLWRLDELVRYPLDVYPGWLQGLLTFAVPYAFVGYYPAAALLGKGGVGPAPALLAGPGLFALALGFWRVSLARYQGTGS